MFLSLRVTGRGLAKVKIALPGNDLKPSRDLALLPFAWGKDGVSASGQPADYEVRSAKAAVSARHFALVAPACVPRVPRAQCGRDPPLPRETTPTKLVRV